MTVNERIALLRAKMNEHGIDYYLITSADAHQSEYVPLHWKSREWISGFTGSAGTVVVTKDNAYLWADGRYHIQAADQIAGSEITLFKWGLDGVPGFIEWLGKTAKDGETIGFDGRAVSMLQFKELEKACERASVTFTPEFDLIGAVWSDRPAMPQDKAFEHALRFAGKSRTEKMNEVRAILTEKHAESTLLASLDDIAWLMNFRGNDVLYTPVVSSYVYLNQNEAVLFIPDEKLQPELKASLLADGVVLKAYEDVFPFVATLENQTILLDANKVSIRLRQALQDSCTVLEATDPSTDLKAVKNDVEQRNIEEIQVRDGVAMVRFIRWVKEAVKHEDLEEADIHVKLTELRAEQEENMGPSFTTIAGYEENAALMHYSPTKGISKKLKAEHMLLVDTGGQYLGGTTDITRTIILGDITPEMKEDFTTVLKSHIGLATARFLKGCAGNNLDVLARLPMWERGLDYKCGTGHGVGYFLSVHEGPQNFSQSPRSSAVFKPGMYVTNEPGIYKENQWGIRTENTLIVREEETNVNGTFYSFDTISYCPIDLAGIDPALLTQKEKNWLNGYHAAVYGKLCNHLTNEERHWLKENTKAI